MAVVELDRGNRRFSLEGSSSRSGRSHAAIRQRRSARRSRDPSGPRDAPMTAYRHGTIEGCARTRHRLSRQSCPSAPRGTRSRAPSATTRSSSSPARPARARRRSCRRSASSSDASRIAHTQPRRIAARTIAERIAEELEVAARQPVGYKVRFTDKVQRRHPHRAHDRRHPAQRDPPRPRCCAATTRSSSTRRTSARSTSTSCSATSRRCSPSAPNSSVIVTSATIDPESFAKHFADAAGNARPDHRGVGPDVPGRGPLPSARRRGRRRLARRGQRRRGRRRDDKDVHGASSPRSTSSTASHPATCWSSSRARRRSATRRMPCAACTRRMPRRPRCCPSTGGLSAAEQHRVFERSKASRACAGGSILATNVAETSLTVPGIRYVIDTGTARISRYSARIEDPAAADRGDLAGVGAAAVGPRGAHQRRHRDPPVLRGGLREAPEFTEPEILRTSLAPVILQMLSLGFGDIEDVPVPDAARLAAASGRRSTCCANSARSTRRRWVGDGPPADRVGRELARLPIDPRFARMLIESKAHGGAARGARDRRRHVDPGRARAPGGAARGGRPAARPLRRPDQRLPHPAEPLEPPPGAAGELSGSAFRRLCRAEHLNYVRVREWDDVHRQLVRLAKPLGLHLNEPTVEPRRDPSRDARRPALAHRAPRRREDVERRRRRGAARESDRKGRRPQAEYVGARDARFASSPARRSRRSRRARS